MTNMIAELRAIASEVSDGDDIRADTKLLRSVAAALEEAAAIIEYFEENADLYEGITPDPIHTRIAAWRKAISADEPEATITLPDPIGTSVENPPPKSEFSGRNIGIADEPTCRCKDPETASRSGAAYCAKCGKSLPWSKGGRPVST
jgi:hypothetical protein